MGRHSKWRGLHHVCRQLNAAVGAGDMTRAWLIVYELRSRRAANVCKITTQLTPEAKKYYAQHG